MRYSTIEELSQDISEGQRVPAVAEPGFVEEIEIISIIPQKGVVQFRDVNNHIHEFKASRFEFIADAEEMGSLIYDTDAFFQEEKDARLEAYEDYMSSVAGRFSFFFRHPDDVLVGNTPDDPRHNYAFADHYLTRFSELNGIRYVDFLTACFSYHNDETGYDYWVTLDSNGDVFHEFFEQEGDTYIIEPVDSDLSGTIERACEYLFG